MADICSYGGGRRHREEERRRLVAASFASGLSLRDFAVRHGVGYSTLTGWRRRYGNLADSGPGFVPVTLTGIDTVPDQGKEVSPSPPVRDEASPQIILTLSNGYRLEVRETIPPRRLKQLLSVLEEA